jgi:hypothetical protein
MVGIVPDRMFLAPSGELAAMEVFLPAPIIRRTLRLEDTLDVLSSFCSIFFPEMGSLSSSFFSPLERL